MPAGRSNTRKILQILRWIHIRPVYLLVPITLSVFAAVFEGAGMGLLIPILNGFIQKNFSFVIDAPYIGPIVHKLPQAVLQNDRLIFGTLLAGFVVVQILKNVFRFTSTASIAYFSERSVHHLRKVLFSRYLSFGKQFFDTTNIGHHNTLLVEFTRNALRPLSMLDKYINSVFALTVYFVMLMAISWRMTVIAVPLFAILHFAIQKAIFKIRVLSRSIAARGSELGKRSVEILSTMALVKSSRTEKEEQKKYTAISDEKARLDYRVSALQAGISPFQEIITLLMATAVFVGALSFFGRDKIASAPALVVYFYIIVNAASKFGVLSGFRGSMASSTGTIDELLKIFDDQSKFFVIGGKKEFGGLTESIVCDDLTFSYTDRDVLKNVSFAIGKGKMTAIVGPTGSGKSTLINLLMRYYDCPPGSILIDGTDIREFTLDSYIGKVAIVSQDTLLLHASLRDNITYGLKDVSESELRDVIERSRLARFVDQLSQGLETLIGDRGVKLSGGEKQRVSIARALLRKAEILILDEATSSLDSQTEKLIQEAIDEAVQGRTSIVIAHRLSTIRDADTILVLKEGRLVEQGTLDELLAKKGVFHLLWEEQKF